MKIIQVNTDHCKQPEKINLEKSNLVIPDDEQFSLDFRRYLRKQRKQPRLTVNLIHSEK